MHTRTSSMIGRAAGGAMVLACAAFLAACTQFPARTESRTGGAAAAAPKAIDATAAREAAASTEYRIGPGDLVKITVYNNPDLATEAEVSTTGRIGFPLIGEVRVGGLTRAEAEKAIATSLSKGGFVPRAHVNLLIAQYRSQQVSVMGEVNKPGTYPISKATGVTELLAMAGGISAKGSGAVIVIQKDPKGGTLQQEFDVKRVLAGVDATNVRLGNDDVIYAPPIPVFYIYGEVRQPGAYPLQPDMTVRQALSVGGGLTVRGSERGVRVERKGKNGRTQSLRPELGARLRPDDVVQVPEGWF